MQIFINTTYGSEILEMALKMSIQYYTILYYKYYKKHFLKRDNLI